MAALGRSSDQVQWSLARVEKFYPCCEHCQFDCPGKTGHIIRCIRCLKGLCVSHRDEDDPVHLNVPEAQEVLLRFLAGGMN